MRFKMIAFAGVSLLLLAGCGVKSPLTQADNGCVQKPVCPAPAQPPAAAPAPPPAYAPADRPRRAARYRKTRRYEGGGYASRTTYAGGSYRYEGETRDYGQVYSTGDTRYAGTRVQVQSTDSYSASSQSSSSSSAYGYAGGYSYAGGSGYAAGCPGACGPQRPRVAGRDRYGYLTWPSK